MTDEIWKPIKDFEDSYEVSSKGRVRSLDKIVVDNLKGTERRRLIKGKILKPYLCKGNGYLLVTLSKNSKLKYKTIHRLVAESFIPNLNSYPSINHKDEDKQNNNLENLEWCTFGFKWLTYEEYERRNTESH